MATITASWTENQTLHTSGTVAAGATATDDIDLAANGYDCVSVTVEVVFGSTADGNCVVDVFASNNSGTDDDTISITSVAIAQTSSTTKRVTLTVADVPYIAVRLTNNDSTDNITYESWYSGRKWVSA